MASGGRVAARRFGTGVPLDLWIRRSDTSWGKDYDRTLD